MNVYLYAKKYFLKNIENISGHRALRAELQINTTDN